MSNWLPESPALFLFLSGRLGKELLLCDVVTPLSSAVFLRRRDVGDVNGHVYGVNFFIPPPLSWSVVWIVSPAWGRYLALTQFYRVFTEFFFGRFSKPTTHRTHSAPWYRVPTEFRRWIRFYRVLFLCRSFFLHGMNDETRSVPFWQAPSLASLFVCQNRLAPSTGTVAAIISFFCTSLRSLS